MINNYFNEILYPNAHELEQYIINDLIMEDNLTRKKIYDLLTKDYVKNKNIRKELGIGRFRLKKELNYLNKKELIKRQGNHTKLSKIGLNAKNYFIRPN